MVPPLTWARLELRHRSLHHRGVSVNGGIGRISGVLIGVLVFEILKTCLQYLGVDTNYQYIAQGIVIVVAIALDIRKYIAKK